VRVLKGSRRLPLKCQENLDTEQRFWLRDLLRYNPKTQQLWDSRLACMGRKVPR
jgi:hypothetical protein